MDGRKTTAKLNWVVLMLALLVFLAVFLLVRTTADAKRVRSSFKERPVVANLTLPGKPGSRNFSEGSVYFVGNATVLIRYGGFTVLTDPNFLHAGQHVHLGYGIQAKRLTNPAMDIEELPSIDLVVLSHYHGDHFDQLAEAKLNRSVPIITTGQAARILKGKGFKATYGLTTWERAVVRKGNTILQITAVPGRHGPGPVVLALPAMNGNMLEFKDGEGNLRYRLYISGDTLVHDDLREIPR